MSRFSHYEPCPRCVANGRDSRGDNLGCYSDGSKYCFACHYRVFANHRVVLEKDAKPTALYPGDFQRNVPAKALKWLLGYGLSYTYWAPLIGWSESWQRLIFEVGDDPSFTIGRYFGEENRRKWHVWGESHATAHSIGEGKEVVLVEDVVSMHKVGQITTCMALFGTQIHPAHVRYLNYLKLPIIIWLDKDQEHRVKSIAFRLQSLLGLPCQVVSTEKDPKELTEKQIGDRIQGLA